MKEVRMLLIVLSALCGLVASAGGQEPAPAEAPGGGGRVHVDQNVRFATVGGKELLMDIARPTQGDGPFPALVFIHGGAWRAGTRQVYAQAIRGFARQGYVAATVDYRLAPEFKFPAQVEDVKCAVRYLRSRAAELKIDPKRMGAIGASAGGHLSLMLGATDDSAKLEGDGGYAGQSSRVQAVVNYFGPAELTLPFEPRVQPLLADFIGGTPEEKPQEYKAASPVTYLTRDDPPILTFHGTADDVVPYQQATALDAACRKAGVSHQLVTLEGEKHGFTGEVNLRTLMQALEFFNEHLKAAN